MENWANNANKIGRRMNECEEDWRENLLPADDDNGAIAKEQWKEGGRAEQAPSAANYPSNWLCADGL